MRFTLLAILALLVLNPAFGEGPPTRSNPDFVPDHAPVKPLDGGGVCPPTVEVTAPLPFFDFGDTCDGTNTITSYTSKSGACQLGDRDKTPYPGEEVVYEITLSASNSVTFGLDLTDSSGDLNLFVLGTCGVASSCVAESDDNIGAGVSETIDAASYPAGTYYVYIDSYYAAGSEKSCGSYTLTVDGTLPVELLEFEIE